MQKKKAILYARCSKGDFQDPETQFRELRVFAAARGWEVVGERYDNITGDARKRRGKEPPELGKAIAAISARKAHVIVIWAADRLVRSPVELLKVVGRIQDAGGAVASLNDGADLDTTTDQGELLLFLRGWMSRMELKLIQARTKAGLQRARAEGKVLGRPRVEVDPEAVAMREGGASWGQIATALGVSRATAKRRCINKRLSILDVAAVADIV